MGLSLPKELSRINSFSSHLSLQMMPSEIKRHFWQAAALQKEKPCSQRCRGRPGCPSPTPPPRQHPQGRRKPSTPGTFLHTQATGRVPLAVMGAPPGASLPPVMLLQNPYPEISPFKRQKLRAATFTHQQTGTQGPLLLQLRKHEGVASILFWKHQGTFLPPFPPGFPADTISVSIKVAASPGLAVRSQDFMFFTKIHQTTSE